VPALTESFSWPSFQPTFETGTGTGSQPDGQEKLAGGGGGIPHTGTTPKPAALPPAANIILMSFSILNNAANSINNLSPEIGRMRELSGPLDGKVPTQSGHTADNLSGNQNLMRALVEFFQHVQTPLTNGAAALTNLQGVFQSVADDFFQMDAAQAAAINMSVALSADYSYPYAQYQYLHDEDLYDSPDWGPKVLGWAGPPTEPVSPTSPFSVEPGVTTSYNLGDVDANPASPLNEYPYGDDGVLAFLPTSETTSVTGDGLTYSETTAFDADQGWGPEGPVQDMYQTVTNPDGTTDIVQTAIDLGGSGMMTEVVKQGGSTLSTSVMDRIDWTTPWEPQG
jgi:hypothetical protein